VSQWAVSSLLIEDNTIVNQLNKISALGLKNYSSVTADIADNGIYGLSDARLASGANVQSGNTVLATLPTIDTSHPWLASPWDKLISGGSTSDVLDGSAGRDLFVGGSGSDTFVIGAGGNSDTIAAFNTPGGNDVVRLEGYGFSSFAEVESAIVQHGDDVVLSLGQGDTLTFQDTQIGALTADNFVFSGPAPFDLPTSGGATNIVRGDGGNNTLMGTVQNDRIVGGGGTDTMQGGAGDDTYVIDSSNDVVKEGAGHGIDTVVSYAASYTLAANVENVTLKAAAAQTAVGNALNNLMTASSGNDTISGSAGNDIIRAGIGADVLTGGAGDDMFVFPSIGAESRITDFHPGEDLLDLTSLLNSGHYSGGDPLADHAIAFAADGAGGTIVSVDPALTGTLHAVVDLKGVAPDILAIGLDVLWH
jgi:Ca2+-binding RTX toxin-like protein